MKKKKKNTLFALLHNITSSFVSINKIEEENKMIV